VGVELPELRGGQRRVREQLQRAATRHGEPEPASPSTEKWRPLASTNSKLTTRPDICLKQFKIYGSIYN
jgi:hypothetical protein